MRPLDILRETLAAAHACTIEGVKLGNVKLRMMLEERGVDAFCFQPPEYHFNPAGSYKGYILLGVSKTWPTGLQMVIAGTTEEAIRETFDVLYTDILDAAHAAYEDLFPEEEAGSRQRTYFLSRLKELGVSGVKPEDDLVEFFLRYGHNPLAIADAKDDGTTFCGSPWADCLKISRKPLDFPNPRDQLKEIESCVRDFFLCGR